MTGLIENQICEAIELFISRNNELSDSNKTVRGYIRGFNRAKNLYQVEYKGELLDMPTVNPGAAFEPGTEVFILLLNNNLNEGKFILCATDNANNPINQSLVWHTSVD